MPSIQGDVKANWSTQGQKGLAGNKQKIDQKGATGTRVLYIIPPGLLEFENTMVSGNPPNIFPNSTERYAG